MHSHRNPNDPNDPNDTDKYLRKPSEKIVYSKRLKIYLIVSFIIAFLISGYISWRVFFS